MKRFHFFILLLSLTFLTFTHYEIYAAEDDSGAASSASEVTDTSELDSYTLDDIYQSLEYIDSDIDELVKITTDLSILPSEDESAYYETIILNLQYIIGFLLILVGFEILRIVKAWSITARGGKDDI